MDGWVDEWMDGWMDGWMNGGVDGRYSVDAVYKYVQRHQARIGCLLLERRSRYQRWCLFSCTFYIYDIRYTRQ